MKKVENGVKNVKGDDNDIEKEALKTNDDDANYVQCLNNIDLVNRNIFVSV